MLLSDPLTSPWLAHTSATLGGLLASTLLALVLQARGRWQTLRASSLFVRWRTWLVIAPLFAMVVLAGPLAVAVFASLLGVQASREYAHLSRLDRLDRPTLLAGCVVAPLACAWLPLAPVLVGLILLATLPPLLGQDVERGAERIARLVFGLAYLALPLSLLVRLDLAHGPGLLLGVALAVGLSDVGAFIVGRGLGRRPLAARLSPSKTWAGLVGNVLGAGLGLLLLPTGQPALIGVIALGSVWGDLLESLLKRTAHVKDTGAWLPGFGGLLDRIDSLLVVLPLTYIVLEVVQ